MKPGESFLVIGTSAASVGIPESLEKGIVQVATAVVSWALIELFKKLKKK